MWYRAYQEVICGVVRLGEEIPWEDEKLREDLDWTREVLVMVHELGHRIVPNYNPKVIETFPLGARLVLAHFRFPGGNMEGATIFEGPYIVHTRKYR